MVGSSAAVALSTLDTLRGIMPKSRGKQDLIPIRELEEAALDALAAASQATVFDMVLENPNTNENYGSGSVKGLRVYIHVKPEAILEMPPKAVILVLPSGMTVPSVKTAAEMKQSERFLWGDLALGTYADPDASTVWWGRLHLKTARRYHEGDRLVFVISNEDAAVAFGAAAIGYIQGRVYVSVD